MAILPEGMNHLNPRDVGGSLSVLENYIRYMRERIEFSSNASKNGLLKRLDALESTVSSLSERVAALEKPTTSTAKETEE